MLNDLDLALLRRRGVATGGIVIRVERGNTKSWLRLLSTSMKRGSVLSESRSCNSSVLLIETGCDRTERRISTSWMLPRDAERDGTVGPEIL